MFKTISIVPLLAFLIFSIFRTDSNAESMNITSIKESNNVCNQKEINKNVQIDILKPLKLVPKDSNEFNKVIGNGSCISPITLYIVYQDSNILKSSDVIYIPSLKKYFKISDECMVCNLSKSKTSNLFHISSFNKNIVYSVLDNNCITSIGTYIGYRNISSFYSVNNNCYE